MDLSSEYYEWDMKKASPPPQDYIYIGIDLTQRKEGEKTQSRTHSHTVHGEQPGAQDQHPDHLLSFGYLVV